MNRMRRPVRIVPSITRMTITTPRYGSYQESKMSALRGALGTAGRRRQPGDNRFEDFRHAGAYLGAGQYGARTVQSDDVLNLASRLFGLRARQVDLVDDRNDLQAVLDRQIRIGQRLGFDALRGIDEQKRTLARGERPRHFVREVDVAGRVNQVEDVGLATAGVVGQADRMGLDRDAALPLEIHGIEHLGLHFTGLERASRLEKTVGQRRLAVVDVGDD